MNQQHIYANIQLCLLETVSLSALCTHTHSVCLIRPLIWTMRVCTCCTRSTSHSPLSVFCYLLSWKCPVILWTNYAFCLHSVFIHQDTLPVCYRSYKCFEFFPYATFFHRLHPCLLAGSHFSIAFAGVLLYLSVHDHQLLTRWTPWNNVRPPACAWYKQNMDLPSENIDPRCL